MQAHVPIGTCSQHEDIPPIAQTAAPFELQLQHAGLGCLLP